jgi:hypothetical protein
MDTRLLHLDYGQLGGIWKQRHMQMGLNVMNDIFMRPS